MRLSVRRHRGCLGPSGRALLAAALALWGQARAAAAPPAEVVLVDGTAGCPTGAELAAALAALLPDQKLSLRSAGGDEAGAAGDGARTTAATTLAASPVVAVDQLDLGPRYRLRVLGVTRELFDPTRDCGARARTAALFVALVLEPPETGPRRAGAPTLTRTARSAASSVLPSPSLSPEPMSGQARLAGAQPRVTMEVADEPEPSEPMPRPEQPTRRSSPTATGGPQHKIRGVDLDLGGIFDAAAGGAGYSGGAFARVSLGLNAYLGVALGGALTTDVAGALEGHSTQLRRTPLDLDLRARFRPWRDLEVAGDLGLGVTVVEARELTRDQDRHAVQADVGVRAALSMRYRLSDRVAPFLSAQLVADEPTHLGSGLDDPGRRPLPLIDAPAVWLSALCGFTVRVN